MTTPNPQQTRLLTLLRELFQLDQPDLDFGLYRIMHAKSREIEQFLEHDLLDKIRERVGGNKEEKIAQAKTAYEREKQNAIEYGGNPDNSPKVQQALAEYKVVLESQDDDTELFDHLYKFLERYYEGGDFLSRRYYARETSEKAAPYAVPYDGSEVYLHWANKDQYYIKTTESFRQFSVDLAHVQAGDKQLFDDATPRKVHFTLVEAEEGAHNNVKAASDKDRYFILDADTPIQWQGDELTVRFHYRADPEKTGQAGTWREARNKLNNTAILAALEKQAQGNDAQATLAQRFYHALATEIPKGKDGTQTLLAKYLNRYTAKNSMDYFIHKNLGAFLKRELDFYIKNELFRLDDLGNADAPNPQQLDKLLKKALTLRDVAHKLIEFLAQTEEFQKKLWLKKKFVVDTQWLVTLDKVPADLYPQIEVNKAQWAEWEKLGFVATKAKRKELLKPESKLVLDTQFFDADFTAQLLASIPNLDEATDGLLVHSENFQALNLMQARYREQVKCIHIDPPYNTATSGFVYKNSYQHSSWLSMMRERIEMSISMLNSIGQFVCHIDENEYERLFLITENLNLFNAGTVIWDKRNPMTGGKGIALQHEYIIWRLKNNEAINLPNTMAISILNKAKELIRKYGAVTEVVKKNFSRWVNGNDLFSGGEKAYRYIDENGHVYQSVSLRAPEPRVDEKFHRPLIHPLSGKPCPVPPNGFSRTPDTLGAMMERGEILFGDDEITQPRQKVFLKADTTRQLTSIIQDAMKGKNYTSPMGLDFPYCHPVSLYEEIFSVSTQQSDVVLDYFAGSGTTGHAVINLNREDKGKRKYILVEMGDYFDTVLKPRIAKVIYSADWKDGKPTAPETGIPQLVKVIRLESYEDTINNLRMAEQSAQGKVIAANPALREKYFLHYLLDMETQSSPSLLSIAAFTDPTAYMLNIKKPGSDAQERRVVDLVESFNWLLGLRVSKLYVPQKFTAEFAQEVDAELPKDAQGRLALKGSLKAAAGGAWWFRAIQGIVKGTGASTREERVLVVWRKLTGNLEQDNLVLEAYLREELKFDVRKAGDAAPFDVVYVNGSHALPAMPLCEVRQLEDAFHRLMWDVQDV